MKNYERWLASNKLGESERAELEALRGNEDEIKERFSSLLSFGTAGLRGTMAMGMHNMNIYTVTQATQGFAAYIRACGEDAVKRGVVVGCDSRHNSRRFSRATAAVMANNLTVVKKRLEWLDEADAEKTLLLVLFGVARTQKYITEKKIHELQTKLNEMGRIIGGLQKHFINNR